ncbi:MAG: hypothetical protein AAF601_06820 [Pseudomonadota bacterium]
MILSDAALLAAHEAGDKAALVALYARAADAVTGPERAFLLTQAHVFAMEINHPEAMQLRAALVEMGCELPL